MLTKSEALKLVLKELHGKGPIEDSLVVVDELTIEKAFGWVFFFNSKKFVETGISKYRLFGNGPIIVNKFGGAIEFCGSGTPPEDIIRDYERKLAGLPSPRTVEELLSQVDSITAGMNERFELWVPEHLTLRGRLTRSDVTMAIILDKILGKGYKPDGFAEAVGGRTYKYKVSRMVQP